MNLRTRCENGKKINPVFQKRYTITLLLGIRLKTLIVNILSNVIDFIETKRNRAIKNQLIWKNNIIDRLL